MGCSSAPNSGELQPERGLGQFQVPVVEALWADEAQRFLSSHVLSEAQAVMLNAIGGGVLGAVAKLLKWFGVPTLADVADVVADVFIYDGVTCTARIKKAVRTQIRSFGSIWGRVGESLGRRLKTSRPVSVRRLRVAKPMRR
jgi:hypothetical protein